MCRGQHDLAQYYTKRATDIIGKSGPTGKVTLNILSAISWLVLVMSADNLLIFASNDRCRCCFWPCCCLSWLFRPMTTCSGSKPKSCGASCGFYAMHSTHCCEGCANGVGACTFILISTNWLVLQGTTNTVIYYLIVHSLNQCSYRCCGVLSPICLKRAMV